MPLRLLLVVSLLQCVPVHGLREQLQEAEHERPDVSARWLVDKAFDNVHHDCTYLDPNLERLVDASFVTL